jgi:hypothetical protein
VAVDFDRTTGEPTTSVVLVPATADCKAGVHIGFVDTPVFDQNSKPVPRREPVYFTMPIHECDQQYCSAGINNGPGNRDIREHFIKNFSEHAFFTVIYEENGEHREFLELTTMFTADYQTLLAELKKPQ